MVEKSVKSTKSTANTSDERLFFEHIGNQISRLVRAYKNASDDIQDLSGRVSAAADNVNYTIVLSRLNAAINYFKMEMTRSSNDYYIIVETTGISPYAATHIESVLNDLYTEYGNFNKNAPEDIVKKGLGKNYFFHKNLKKLTVEVILSYFETNYMMHMEKEGV